MPLFGRDRNRVSADLAHALTPDIRFRIVQLFTEDADRPLTATALKADLSREQKFRHVTVSQVHYHLSCLQDAKLLPVPPSR